MKILILIIACLILQSCSIEKEDKTDQETELIDTGLVSIKFHDKDDQEICLGMIMDDGSIEPSDVSSISVGNLLNFENSQEYMVVRENLENVPLETHCLYVDRGFDETEPEFVLAKSKLFIANI